MLVFGFFLVRRKTMKRQTLGNQVRGGGHSGEMLTQQIEMPGMNVGLQAELSHRTPTVRVRDGEGGAGSTSILLA